MTVFVGVMGARVSSRYKCFIAVTVMTVTLTAH